MTERQATKPEIAAQKRTIKLAPAIGDWTTYKPPKVLVKQVKSGLYGFDRMSKEEINLCLKVHYRFIQDALDSFKLKLNMASELYTASMEQSTYLNFLRTLNGPVVQAQITIPDLHDKILVYISMPLVSSIINFSLGAQDLDTVNRALTEAEVITLNTAFEDLMPSFKAAFAGIFDQATFSYISSAEIAIDSSINPSSTFAYFTAEIAAGDKAPCKLYLCYTGPNLKSLITKYKKKIDQQGLDLSPLPASLLAKVKIPVSARIGKSFLTTNELDTLQAGDVVNLDQMVNAALELDIAKKLALKCQPGKKDKKNAVKLALSSSIEDKPIAPPILTSEIKPEKPVLQALPKKPVEETASVEEPEEEDLFDEDFTEEDFSDEDFKDLK